MRIGLLLATAFLVLPVLGCGENIPSVPDAVVSGHRDRLLLTAEPEDLVTVLDIRESLKEPREVALVGTIGGMKNPWTNGKAQFVLADPTAPPPGEAEHECTNPGCKFCAAKKKKDDPIYAVAVVEFVDAAGKILPIDARRLFDLKADQTVVVRGQARVNEVGCMVVQADGIYVRR